MDSLLSPVNTETLYATGTLIEDWIFVVAAGLLLFEFLRYALRKELGWSLVGDAVASYVTLAAYLAVLLLGLGTVYVGAYYWTEFLAPFDIPTNALTIALCVVLADFAYYWEHRFTHRVGIGWATHSVHHSSPHYNLSVANRFGPMDAVWPILFNAPIVLIGYDPLVVFFASAMVLTYQTFLHTEAVGKLPRWIEYVMNTPSHHRVHHGSNPEYLDRNYAGMFIVWDRLFGTFEEERAPVTYGLVEPINSNNPITIWFHGFTRLIRKVAGARGIGGKTWAVFAPPGE